MTSTPDREPSVLAEPRAVCPYLLMGSGRWRNAEPSREHVCASEPDPIPIGLEAQRRLCFEDFEACARFEAAAAAYRAAVPLAPLRPVARTVPVVVDRGRAPLPVPRVVGRRTLGQAVLAMAMIGAAAALLLARPGGPTGGGAGQSAGPSGLPGVSAIAEASPSAGPSVVASPSIAPSPSVSATATPRPTPKPSPTATPGTGQTYTVQPGDTMSSIAARFGTTVKKLSALNGITNPSLIHPGQVLKIP
ncbi:MAG: LysM peptidoglycan-binding domain-containing protein [Candidatus Limnocylindrales bacterium]